MLHTGPVQWTGPVCSERPWCCWRALVGSCKLLQQGWWALLVVAGPVLSVVGAG